MCIPGGALCAHAFLEALDIARRTEKAAIRAQFGESVPEERPGPEAPVWEQWWYECLVFFRDLDAWGEQGRLDQDYRDNPARYVALQPPARSLPPMLSFARVYYLELVSTISLHAQPALALDYPILFSMMITPVNEYKVDAKTEQELSAYPQATKLFDLIAERHGLRAFCLEPYLHIPYYSTLLPPSEGALSQNRRLEITHVAETTFLDQGDLGADRAAPALEAAAARTLDENADSPSFDEIIEALVWGEPVPLPSGELPSVALAGPSFDAMFASYFPPAHVSAAPSAPSPPPKEVRIGFFSDPSSPSMSGESASGAPPGEMADAASVEPANGGVDGPASAAANDSGAQAYSPAREPPDPRVSSQPSAPLPEALASGGASEPAGASSTTREVLSRDAGQTSDVASATHGVPPPKNASQSSTVLTTSPEERSSGKANAPSSGLPTTPEVSPQRNQDSDDADSDATVNEDFSVTSPPLPAPLPQVRRRRRGMLPIWMFTSRPDGTQVWVQANGATMVNTNSIRYISPAEIQRRFKRDERAGRLWS